MAQEQERCQPVQKKLELNTQEIASLGLLQAEFDRALGRVTEQEDLLKRSYNPVVDRWHVEGLQKISDEEERSAKLEEHKKEMQENLRTNLMERMHAIESYGKFTIKDEKLYSELFPHESMGQILLRGANVRASHGSPEQEREGMLGELTGWLKINDTLVHGEIGTKIISLSPPGIAEGTSYYGKFVDVYEVAQEKGEKVVNRARIAVDFDNKAYESTALTLDPTFFDTYDGRPMDAWYLSRPVVVTGDLKNVHLSTKGMSSEEFDRIYAVCTDAGLIDYYLQTVHAEPVDWREVARAFNTILTVADRAKDGESLSDISDPLTKSIRRNPEEEARIDNRQRAAGMVKMLGEKKVKDVGGGGCPPNKGISFDNPIEQYTTDHIVKELLANSVGQFGMEEIETWSYHRGECRLCAEGGDHGTKDVGPCEICKDCEKKF